MSEGRLREAGPIPWPASAAPDAIRPEPAAPAEAVRPVTWDYKTVVLEHGFMGWRSEEVDLRALDEQLEELGADGWELVHVFWNQRIRGRRGGHLLLLKRPGAPS